MRTGRNNAPGIDGTSPQWAAWVERWHATSALSPRVRATVRPIMAKAGRWLADEHPEILEPGQWTRQICAAWVSAVDRMVVGDYVQRHDHIQARAGKPIRLAPVFGRVTTQLFNGFSPAEVSALTTMLERMRSNITATATMPSA